MDDQRDAQRLAAWRAYIESSQRLLTLLGDELREHCGLSLADYHVLLLLSEAPGRRLRMGELASRLVFSPSRLTYQVATMQRRGLVERQSCPQDRRGSHAVLTAEGLNQLRVAAPVHLAAVRRVFLDHLDDADIAQLGQVFGALDARLGGPSAGASGPDCGAEVTSIVSTTPARKRT
ncbi:MULTISPECIES: MarR family winged helix-turn-helix transcriptional regulator [unclassified Solwaraspora]|uniref:MarR family winged helix-turn-helix transcriptional regulator n=1 Tax=unclassified Solwaraspora TaxID=2627926 RepID=UPI00259BA003|nr:MarR family transcriptional regulator [Solwaraspora sp. WMMA2056]WJK39421.1 MarR family transcriptional regulator [Solwaraspora sp. WMMA2056]